MKVLSNQEFSHAITWMPSGKSFSVLKPKVFTAQILPDHFKSAKYSSFTRKLHRWGFARHYKGDEAGAFYHKDFQKDRIDLAEMMSCEKALEPIWKEGLSEREASAPANSSADRVLEHQHQQSILRASLPTTAITMPSVVRRESNATSLQSLPHGFSQAHLSIPVPKQVSQQRYEQEHLAPLINLPENALVAAKINAAIELEVSRRLQDRINAAAAQMTRGSNALNGLLQLPSQASMQRTAIPVSDITSASTTWLRAKLEQMRQQKELMQYLAVTGKVPMSSQGLGEMPHTNIQGAKTA
jgi:Trp operon repressor